MPAERAMWFREEEDLERDLRFIHDEFKAGLELVASIDRPTAAIFGSARIAEDHPWYAAARALIRAELATRQAERWRRPASA